MAGSADGWLDVCLLTCCDALAGPSARLVRVLCCQLAEIGVCEYVLMAAGLGDQVWTVGACSSSSPCTAQLMSQPAVKVYITTHVSVCCQGP